MAAKKLPLYELTVDGLDSPMPAVTYTAMVDRPAIESSAMFFSADDKPDYKFKIDDEERRLVTGAAMIPNLPIYRRDENGVEFNVFFSEKTVETIMKKWAKSGYHNNVNLMHDCANKPDGVFLFESIMVDKSRGVSAPKVLKGNFPDRTWIHTYYVENDEVWEGFKSGKYTGFSIEGYFGTGFKVALPDNYISDFIKLCDQAVASFGKQ